VSKLSDRLDAVHQDQQQRLAESSSRYAPTWKFRDEPVLEGVVVDRREFSRTKKRDDGTEYQEKVPVLEVESPHGERRSAICGQVQSKGLVELENPQPGDEICLKYFGEEPNAQTGNRQTVFGLVVERQGDSTPEGDAPVSDRDFGER
jgi:hypothetical protein